jgi:hypothetical protein
MSYKVHLESRNLVHPALILYGASGTASAPTQCVHSLSKYQMVDTVFEIELQLPSPNPARESIRFHKLSIAVSETFAQKVKVIPLDELRDQFHHFEMRDVSAHTSPRTGTKGQVILFHGGQSLWRCLFWIPALWYEVFGVLTEDISVPVRDPWVDVNDRLARC